MGLPSPDSEPRRPAAALRRCGRLALLDAALTHASYCSGANFLLPSYQALEFLGGVLVSPRFHR